MNLENFKSKFDWKFYVMYHKIARSVKKEGHAWNHACKIGCKTARDVFKSKELSAQFRTFMRKVPIKSVSTVAGQKTNWGKHKTFNVNTEIQNANLKYIFTNSHNYIINLKDRYEKKMNVMSQFENVGMKYEVVEAINSLNQKVYGNYLKPGEIGYKKTIEQIFTKNLHRNDDEYICIYDDDVLFSKNFIKRINESKISNDFDILYLGASEWSDKDLSKVKTGYYFPTLYRDPKFGDGTCGTFACAYKMSFVREFLEFLKINHDAYDRLLRNFLKCSRSTAYVMYPNLIITSLLDSDIRKPNLQLAQQKIERNQWNFNDYFNKSEIPPLFSFAIISQNRGNYLNKTLRYIKNQKLEKSNLDPIYYEIVVVDDNSSDNTKEILKKESNITTNLIYCSNDSSIGIPRARNKVNSMCNGKYIIVTDDDDIILEQRLCNILSTIKSTYNKFAGVYGSWIDYHMENDKYEFQPGGYLTDLTLMFNGKLALHPMLCYRKDVIMSIMYNEEIPFNSDWCVLSTMLCEKYKFTHSCSCDLIKIDHPRTTTNTKPKFNYVTQYRSILLRKYFKNCSDLKSINGCLTSKSLSNESKRILNNNSIIVPQLDEKTIKNMIFLYIHE